MGARVSDLLTGRVQTEAKSRMARCPPSLDAKIEEAQRKLAELDELRAAAADHLEELS